MAVGYFCHDSLSGKFCRHFLSFFFVPHTILTYKQVPQKVPQQVPKSKKVPQVLNFWTSHHTLFVLGGFLTIFCHIFDIDPYFAIFFLKTGTILPVGHRTRDYGMTLQTIIALPFPYLIISTLQPFMVRTKNTFLENGNPVWRDTKSSPIMTVSLSVTKQ